MTMNSIQVSAIATIMKTIIVANALAKTIANITQTITNNYLSDLSDPPVYASLRQSTPVYASLRQSTPVYASLRRRYANNEK
jgi:hypothetical protein